MNKLLKDLMSYRVPKEQQGLFVALFVVFQALDVYLCRSWGLGYTLLSLAQALIATLFFIEMIGPAIYPMVTIRLAMALYVASGYSFATTHYIHQPDYFALVFIVLSACLIGYGVGTHLAKQRPTTSKKGISDFLANPAVQNILMSGVSYLMKNMYGTNNRRSEPNERVSNANPPSGKPSDETNVRMEACDVPVGQQTVRSKIISPANAANQPSNNESSNNNSSSCKINAPERLLSTISDRPISEICSEAMKNNPTIIQPPHNPDKGAAIKESSTTSASSSPSVVSSAPTAPSISSTSSSSSTNRSRTPTFDIADYPNIAAVLTGAPNASLDPVEIAKLVGQFKQFYSQ